MQITALDLARRFIGLREIPGIKDQPWIVWAHSLCRLDAADETPWCSSFANAIAWMLSLPRSESAAARSWLKVGQPVATLELAKPGFDVVVLKRGTGPQPGPEVLAAPGHVGFLSHVEGTRVWLLGGNQQDSVSIASFNSLDVLGIRRLA